MENNENSYQRPVNPRRRRKTKFQIFKEAYLPTILIVLAVVLVIVFIVTAVNSSKKRREEEAIASSEAAASSEAEQLRLDQLANDTLAEAQTLAASYYYDEAIEKLSSFEKIYDYDALLQARDSYKSIKNSLVLWNEPGKVKNLSFHLLIQDAKKAFANKEYKETFKWNFITTTEFSNILNQLYANGYVLVMMDDIVSATQNADGSYTYAAKDLYLPEGKTPLMITQTQVNYFTYMTDGNGDGLPDADGSGFASKLIVDANGKLTNEMVDVRNQTVTGSYDLVPILNDFIEAHPDFSYQGAKAILAVCAYDGVFGYRTDAETKEKLGEDFYQEQLTGAKKLMQALKDDGYQIACYTYANRPYGDMSASRIQSDLDKWTAEVTPLLGECDILVYAKGVDITDSGASYAGDKYQVLKDFGFRYYYGFCDNYQDPWIEITSEYVRQGRIMVTGHNLTSNPGMFEGLFKREDTLDKNR